MKVCVLQPDYSTTDVDYKNYDPPRNLSPLLPDHEVDHVFLNKLTTYKQLKQLSKEGYDIFVNLCEGYLEWSVPSIDVIHSLDSLNLPYTGPNAILYDPRKDLMKYVAFTVGVDTPPFRVGTPESFELCNMQGLRYPLFVKPAKAGDSLGIDKHSLIHNSQELLAKASSLFKNFDAILVEEYIKGREFTVLVSREAGKQNNSCIYKPVEFIFPEGYAFKTYELKTSELHPGANISCDDEVLSARLKQAAGDIFGAFNGVGYARLDFRLSPDNVIYFLDINFTCSVFYEDGYEGSADYILLNDGGKQQFLESIIAEGIYRHQAKQKKYIVNGNALAGYGIYATKNLSRGEMIFPMEENDHRIVTKNYVLQNWSPEQIENFRRYAYPVSEQVYVLWANDPADWAPQNHSCSPNTMYEGLNVVATKDIFKGEELTLDYTVFLNDDMESFICNCSTPACRKLIQGRGENSITFYENNRRLNRAK